MTSQIRSLINNLYKPLPSSLQVIQASSTIPSLASSIKVKSIASETLSNSTVPALILEFTGEPYMHAVSHAWNTTLAKAMINNTLRRAFIRVLPPCLLEESTKTIDDEFRKIVLDIFPCKLKSRLKEAIIGNDSLPELFQRMQTYRTTYYSYVSRHQVEGKNAREVKKPENVSLLKTSLPFVKGLNSCSPGVIFEGLKPEAFEAKICDLVVFQTSLSNDLPYHMFRYLDSLKSRHFAQLLDLSLHGNARAHKSIKEREPIHQILEVVQQNPSLAQSILLETCDQVNIDSELGCQSSPAANDLINILNKVQDISTKAPHFPFFDANICIYLILTYINLTIRGHEFMLDGYLPHFKSTVGAFVELEGCDRSKLQTLVTLIMPNKKEKARSPIGAKNLNEIRKTLKMHGLVKS